MSMEDGRECKRCGFVACICKRGERDDGPRNDTSYREETPNMNTNEKNHAALDDEKFDDFENDLAAGRYDVDRDDGSDAGAVEEAGDEDDTKPVRRTGPGSRYVEVPAESIHEALRKAGFEQGSFGGEIVYKRAHAKCKHLTIQVFTSLPVRGGDVRGCGDDAIRVNAVFEKALRNAQPGDRPFVRIVHKGKRVHRSGSVEAVIKRMVERAREAYGACNEFCKSTDRCYECCGSRGVKPGDASNTSGAYNKPVGDTSGRPAGDVQYVKVEGNTYPHREALKAMGGRWNPGDKCWMVPSAEHARAVALVAGGGS